MKGAARWIGWLLLLALLAHPVSHVFDDHAHESGKVASHQCALCSPLTLSPVSTNLEAVSWMRFEYAPSVHRVPSGLASPFERGRAPPSLTA